MEGKALKDMLAVPSNSDRRIGGERRAPMRSWPAGWRRPQEKDLRHSAIRRRRRLPRLRLLMRRRRSVRHNRNRDLRRLWRHHTITRSHAGKPGLHVFWTLRQMHVLEPRVLEATPMGHDPVIEGDARIPASQLAHLKTSRSFASYIQTAAVTVGSEKDVVAGCGVNGLEKPSLKGHCGRATLQLRRAEIFEPILRAFDRVERHLPPVLHLHPRRLAPGHGQIAADVQVAAGIDAKHLREIAAPALKNEPLAR